jgi:hypothetical protein
MGNEHFKYLEDENCKAIERERVEVQYYPGVRERRWLEELVGPPTQSPLEGNPAGPVS